MSKSFDDHQSASLYEIQDKPMCIAAYSHKVNRERLEYLNRYYSTFVSAYPNWSFAGLYAGQKSSNSPELLVGGFPELIADCRMGKIDLIVTRSFSCFKRNFMDTFVVVQKLKTLNPPVGLYFENEEIYTLHKDSDFLLLAFSLMALQESENKGKHTGYLALSSVAYLKCVRVSKNMTQQEVADKAGINIRHYQMFESGSRNLMNASFGITVSVLQALGIDIASYARANQYN